MLEGLGHRALIGDAAEVRRPAKRWQKNDRRDASFILDLLLRGEFPQSHRPPFESREVLRLLRHRHKLAHALEPVSRFAGGREVAAYVGLDPTEYSSGGRQRFGSNSRGGSRLLRYLSVEAARITLRRDEGLKRFYRRLPGRRGSQKARAAVARKLLIRGHIFLRDGVGYAEFLRRGVAARPARPAT